ncbi:MAG: ANTAR domain-containing protein, partial [Hyphomonadaceae bacterium]|nr:ANTAR domain-containing protein [Clostridia bacterium]
KMALSHLAKSLEERKVIERAKGLLMERHHFSEHHAHRHIQKHSMDSGAKLVDIAKGILETAIIDPQNE